MESIRRGNAAEAAVLAGLVEAGFHVFTPFGEGTPFDLLVLVPNGSIVRIQVKSGRVRGECLVVNTCSTDHGRGRSDYRGRADVIAAHVPGRGVFVLHVDECPTYLATLRLSRPRNNQQAGVRMASDHTLQRWITSLAGVEPATAGPVDSAPGRADGGGAGPA